MTRDNNLVLQESCFCLLLNSFSILEINLQFGLKKYTIIIPGYGITRVLHFPINLLHLEVWYAFSSELHVYQKIITFIVFCASNQITTVLSFGIHWKLSMITNLFLTNQISPLYKQPIFYDLKDKRKRRKLLSFAMCMFLLDQHWNLNCMSYFLDNTSHEFLSHQNI